MINPNNYGSVQFYTDMFADILADIQHDNPVYGDNIIAGFKAALREWRQYHEEQVKEYQRIEEKANDEIWLHWWVKCNSIWDGSKINCKTTPNTYR